MRIKVEDCTSAFDDFVFERCREVGRAMYGVKEYREAVKAVVRAAHEVKKWLKKATNDDNKVSHVYSQLEDAFGQEEKTMVEAGYRQGLKDALQLQNMLVSGAQESDLPKLANLLTAESSGLSPFAKVSLSVADHLQHMCEGLIQDGATEIFEAYQQDDDGEDILDRLSEAVEHAYGQGVAAGIALAAELGPAAQHLYRYALNRQKERIVYHDFDVERKQMEDAAREDEAPSVGDR